MKEENSLMEIIYYRLLEMEQRLAEREKNVIKATENLESLLIKAEVLLATLKQKSGD